MGTEKNTEQPLVSVLIPAYNVAEYVERALDSLQNQTYKNLEVVVVDDGSTDETLAICQRYAEKDKRFRIVHQENQGVSAARNTALAHATGEYIGFVDADDYAEATMYEELLNVALLNDADIASCSYWYEEYDNKIFEGTGSGETIVKGRDEIIEDILNVNNIISVFWNRIYRRHVFEGVVFPVGRVDEDTQWLTFLFQQSSKSVWIDHPLYHYTYRPESIVHPKAYDPIRSYSHLQARIERLRMLPTDIQEQLILQEKASVTRQAIHFVSHISIIATTSRHHAMIRKLVSYLQKSDYNGLTLAYKLKLFCIKHNWNLYSKCYVFFRKLFRKQGTQWRNYYSRK